MLILFSLLTIAIVQNVQSLDPKQLLYEKPLPARRRKPQEPKKFPIFKVKHNASYREKWEQVQKELGKEFQEMATRYIHLIQRPNIVSREFISYLDNIENLEIANTLPEFIEELKVISEVFNVPFRHVVYLNFVYETFSHQNMCTSVIIRDKKGNLIHGRNLDYFLQRYYGRTSIQFDFYDENGKLSHSLGTYVGYAIAHTAIKYGKYSITLNQRSKGTSKDSIEALKRGQVPNVYLNPYILKRSNSYKESLELLRNTPLIATSYHTISGVESHQAAMVERDRNAVHQQYNLDDEKWFIVITNSDLNVKDPDSRRDEAEKKIQQIGQEITEQQLYDEVLLQYPNFNYETVSSSMLNARLSTFEQEIHFY